tara:strand:+ start:19916 stop:20167 length:252 start_codon:yes stop_codon:yes gene_type:complete
MADQLVRYASKHKAAIFAVVVAIFTAGGVVAVARADVEDLKKHQIKNSERLSTLEADGVGVHQKLDDISDDLKLIKDKLIPQQ